jgi:hypothetical protein
VVIQGAYRWGRAAADMHADQGLAVGKFTGVLQVAGTKQAAQAFAAHLGQAGVAAGVIDYTEADCTAALPMLSHQVRQVAKQARSLMKPGAYLVRRDDLPMWSTYARRMCGAGMLRAAFSDPEAARAWAAEMAALRAAQATHHALWR